MERRGTTVRLLAPAPGTQDIIAGADTVRILGPLAAVLRVTLTRAQDDEAG